MLRFFMILGCLCIFWAAQAGASTYRLGATYQIQFDVIDSEIILRGALINLTRDEEVDPTSEEYAAFVAGNHPLGAALGQTGTVTLELQVEDWSPPYAGRLSCVSGFLCSTNTFWAGSSDSRPLGVYLDGYNPDNVGFDPIYTGWYDWQLRGSTLFFNDDDFTGDTVNFGGDQYLAPPFPQATFTVVNVTATELAPVPLPATAPALAAGVLILGTVRMRRRARRG